MRLTALALLAAYLGPVGAAAHPMEPLVTGTPMPVPRDQLAVSSSYSALHGGEGTVEEVEFEGAAGIGDQGELTARGSIDATEGRVGAIAVGAKLLVFMEGPTGIDLALAGSLATDRSAEGAVLAGRSLAPGFYLRGASACRGRPRWA